MKRLVALLLVATAFAANRIAPDPAYVSDYDKWKTERLDDLKQNWIPLVGLYWLKPGANSFGSDSANDITLPAGSAPAKAGAFDFQNGVVTVKLEPGVIGKVGSAAVTTAKLTADNDKGQKPSVLEMGSLRLHVIKRGQRTGIRVKDVNSAALRSIKPMDFYPVDLNYRVIATWVPADGKKTVDVPTEIGDVSHTVIPGELRFKLNGKEMTLTALSGSPEKSLFIVFNDATKQTDTYPAGRFIDTPPVKDGKVVLDFNRAYNPPCAFTPYATCPLAPKENRLSVAIPAGEKYENKAH